LSSRYDKRKEIEMLLLLEWLDAGFVVVGRVDLRGKTY
jgi:hypothetical protein